MTSITAHLGQHLHLHAGDMLAAVLITTLLLAICERLTKKTK